VSNSSTASFDSQRRRALRILWGSVTAVFAAPVVYIVSRYLSPPPLLGAVTVVGREDELGAGGERIVKVGTRDAFVARSADGTLYALDLACTHAGCTVAWDSARHAFLCPCHDGRFARDGAVLGGPPTVPLHRLAVETKRGLILVTDEHV
jgi:Rieske Fe-S protein